MTRHDDLNDWQVSKILKNRYLERFNSVTPREGNHWATCQIVDICQKFFLSQRILQAINQELGRIFSFNLTVSWQFLTFSSLNLTVMYISIWKFYRYRNGLPAWSHLSNIWCLSTLNAVTIERNRRNLSMSFNGKARFLSSFSFPWFLIAVKWMWPVKFFLNLRINCLQGSWGFLRTIIKLSFKYLTSVNFDVYLTLTKCLTFLEIKLWPFLRSLAAVKELKTKKYLTSVNLHFCQLCHHCQNFEVNVILLSKNQVSLNFFVSMVFDSCQIYQTPWLVITLFTRALK